MVSLSPAGDPIRDYRYGAELLAQVAADGERSYYHHNDIGSVTHVTAADGQAQWAYDYEPFGALRDAQQLTDGAPANPMRFTGEHHDSETDLYHLRLRQYDPTTGTFLTPDPIAPAIDDPYVSAYVYANNRPSVLKDPSGEIPVLAVIAIGVAAGAVSGGTGAAVSGGDRGDIAKGAGIGAGVGLAGSFFAPATLTGAAALGAASGAGGDVAGQFVGGRRAGELDPTQTLVAGASGAASGLFGGLGAQGARTILGAGQVGQAAVAGAAGAFPLFHLPSALYQSREASYRSRQTSYVPGPRAPVRVPTPAQASMK